MRNSSQYIPPVRPTSARHRSSVTPRTARKSLSSLPHFCAGSRPSSQTVGTHIIEHAGDSPGVGLGSATGSRDGPKSGLRTGAGQLRVPGAQVCGERTGQQADVCPPRQGGPFCCWAWLAPDTGAPQGLSGVAERVKGGYGGKVLPSAVRRSGPPAALTVPSMPRTRLHLRKPSWAGTNSHSQVQQPP